MQHSNSEARSDIYISLTASAYRHNVDLKDGTTPSSVIKAYHQSLPDFNTTPLHNLPQLASALGIDKLLIKSESSRLGLPAFKILGASWGAYRALCESLEQPTDPEQLPIDALRNKIQRQRKPLTLFAATEGNHGRAVARTARLLLPEPMQTQGETRTESGSRCVIFVPRGMYTSTKKLIESEGAEVVTVDGDYDQAVAKCWSACQQKEGGIMVQDNAFEGYEIVPAWIIEGYGTLLAEVDEQYQELLKEHENSVNDSRCTINDGTDHIGQHITHVVTPIGVGSLGNAVVNWAKDTKRTKPVRVIVVEPETAACLNVSLHKGQNTIIETKDTIMSGMCCGTVSPISWETLRDGVDCSVTVGDWEAHETVLELARYKIDAGPCGAGCLAGLRKVVGDESVREKLEIDEKSVVVVLCTEGKREYPVPERP